MKTLILFSLFYLSLTSALYAESAENDFKEMATPAASSAENKPSGALNIQSEYGLKECGDENFGISFLCNPDWLMQKGEEAILVVISRNPDVSLIIARIPSKFKYLEEISTEDLLDLKQYQSGFQIEHVKFNGRDALMVKAVSIGQPEKRILDYFLIKDKTLYTILFSVDPKEKWEDYKFLIKTIADSIQFTPGHVNKEDFYRG